MPAESPIVHEAKMKAQKLEDIKVQINELKLKEKAAKEELVAAMQKANLDEVVIGEKKFELEYVEDYKVKIKKA